MGSVSKLTSIAISLTILALFVTAIVAPIISSNTVPGVIYKTDKDGNQLDKEGNKVSDSKNPPVILKEAPKITGRTTINAIVQLFPLFLGIGGLFVIIKTFQNKR